MDHAMNIDDDFDPIDSLNNLEETFYKQGYSAGHAHGQLHGLFEGRSLGKEKCFDLWEEIGYIEGVAIFWKGVGEKQKKVDVKDGGGGKKGLLVGEKKVSARALTHINTLLNLISQFPITNPTPSDPLPPSLSSSSHAISNQTPSHPHPHPPTAQPETEIDLAAHLERIRARYKLLCSSLSIRPRLMIASNNYGGIQNNQEREEGGDDGMDGLESTGGQGPGMGIVGGIEGPMKGVDTRLLRY